MYTCIGIMGLICQKYIEVMRGAVEDGLLGCQVLRMLGDAGEAGKEEGQEGGVVKSIVWLRGGGLR